MNKQKRKRIRRIIITLAVIVLYMCIFLASYCGGNITVANIGGNLFNIPVFIFSAINLPRDTSEHKLDNLFNCFWVCEIITLALTSGLVLIRKSEVIFVIQSASFLLSCAVSVISYIFLSKKLS